MGKNMIKVLKFAIELDGKWHTYDKRDRQVYDAIKSLKQIGLVETNCYEQFRIVKEFAHNEKFI